jgi:hypothetical protein
MRWTVYTRSVMDERRVIHFTTELRYYRTVISLAAVRCVSNRCGMNPLPLDGTFLALRGVVMRPPTPAPVHTSLSGVTYMAGAGSKDPRWDQVVEIAAKLWIDGVYVARLDPSPTQRFVDLQWAARQAGRVLGGRAVVHTRDAQSPEDSKVTVTVTFVDPDGRGFQRAEEGLETLLRKVLAAQSRGCS